MIAVSDAWKSLQQRFLLPEAFLEIKCAITETGVQETAVPSGTNEAFFSDVAKVTIEGDTTATEKYATNELNLWALDGSMSILPDSAPYGTAGYVSDIEATGSVTLTLPEVHTVAIPGVTVTWSSGLGEYPPVFTVTAKNGDTVVAETTVTDNTEQVCLVDLEINNYDSVTVTVHNWCLPHRRPRIETISLGHTLTLTKKDIMSYTHEQHGDLLSGELPKNSIEFTLDNTDGRWNPYNPEGMEKYLSERQKVTVRYGLDIDGVTEWIKAGTFYLSEWNTPANGFEASFVARDIFEYFLNEVYTYNKGGTLTAAEPSLEEVILDVFASVDVPDDFTYDLSADMLPFYVPTIDQAREYTCAEMIQMCANMACSMIYQDRDGTLHIATFSRPAVGDTVEYIIPSSLSYSHPEIELSKPLKRISVTYGEETHVLEVGSKGETQTVDNPLVGDLLYAEDIANFVQYVLESRKSVSGEFRADPRLDLFDIVTVESKYGELTPVAITNIKYTFNGAFKATYSGRVLEMG